MGNIKVLYTAFIFKLNGMIYTFFDAALSLSLVNIRISLLNRFTASFGRDNASTGIYNGRAA
jgi:hypothetical protein